MVAHPYDPSIHPAAYECTPYASQSATAAENQLLATDRKRREEGRERGAFVNVEEEEGII